jgi:hypothetical protein
MSIREKLNRNPKLAGGLAAAAVVVVVGLVGYQLLQFNAAPDEPMSFFSVDDGQTYFAAPISNIDPFEHKGKTAVRAIVYRIGGEEKVGYLRRHTPEGKQLLEANAKARADGKPEKTGDLIRVSQREIEVKKPGEANWVSIRDQENYYKVTLTPVAPDGTAAVTVEPD